MSVARIFRSARGLSGLLAAGLIVTACGGGATSAPSAGSATTSASSLATSSSSKASTSSAATSAASGSASAATSPATSSASSATASSAAGGAVKEVLIGDLLPLTGIFAGSILENRWAAETAVELVNNKHEGITLPLAQGQGLPNLGGAKLKLLIRDDQSKGELARTVAEQMITQDKVVWLNGDTTSGNTSIIQPVAESHGIPMSCHPCASPSLTEKGFKYFWRTGPTDRTMVGNMFTFLKEWKERGGPDLKTAAVIACDNIFCQDGRKLILENAQTLGLDMKQDLTVKEDSATLSSEVQRLRAANPDILFVVLYQSSTTVMLNAMKQFNWMPKVYMTNDGAYSFTSWLTEAPKTNLSAGFMGRDPTAVDLASKNPNWVKVNEVYKTFSGGKDMGELAMREFTGWMWMADVINRAGSTDPAKLLKAAAETNTPADQLIIDYKGIKFDDHNQNILASGIMTQIGWDGQKHTIWPWDLAAKVDYKIIYPNPSWQERASHPTP